MVQHLYPFSYRNHLLWVLPFYLLFTTEKGYSFTSTTPNEVKMDSIRSSLDGVMQTFYYYASTATNNQPLVVMLHQWSSDYRVKDNTLREQAIARNWNYLFPNFRGPNTHPKACCSEYVISDIDEVIDWAFREMKLDKRKVYIVGVSGGGYAALCALMKSRHQVATYAAWVPITDLTKWYAQSVERNNRYAGDILHCTGSAADSLDVAKARARSPQYWQTPAEKLTHTKVKIYAGIHDGYTGSVPISHSIDFYNKLLTDMKIQDQSKFITDGEKKYLLENRSFPVKTAKRIGNRKVFLERKTKNISITIFDGGHEIVPDVALEILN
jgi:pimeloyl-ACP methyl ester carboxylesterase